jgi:ABC-type Fe3+-hydroxamate transport system substrate-binding protein
MPLFLNSLSLKNSLPETPTRIVSLVPSQTELLHYLGLEKEVVGITKFCVHPGDWFRTKTRIGGTKTVNMKKVQYLKPDLIIANKEENVKQQIEELANDFPVWVSDVNNLEDAYAMIEAVGSLTGKESRAQDLVSEIQNDFGDHQQSSLQALDKEDYLRTAYLIWKDPYMTVGGDTFIHDMLCRAGFTNAFSDKKRYPEVSIDDLRAVRCRFVLLSSEPYPFKQKHIDELHKLLPDAKIVLVDGEMFSWYGSRLVKAASYFKTLHQQIEAMA